MHTWEIIGKVPGDIKADIDAFKDSDGLIRWFTFSGQPQRHPLFQKHASEIFCYYGVRLAQMCRHEELLGSSKCPSRIY